jgi:hypothetical protein
MHECLVRLGAWMPFQEAVKLLQDMLGVQVSKAQAVRITEAAGAAYVAVQTEEAKRILSEAPEARAGSERLVFSADGAMIRLRGGEWGEVKTLAVGEVPSMVNQKDSCEVHTQRISYFSRMTSAEQFEQLTLVEFYRRGLEKSRQVGAVMDGADWLQSFVDYHRPDAIRILDFPHAAQRIGQVGQALFGEGTPESSQWVGERLHGLKHQGPATILDELRGLQEQHPELEVLAENLAYLEKREAQMQYPQFQAQGWPIGSGMVESGNKLVVEARLKGAGMHWERGHVNAMLGLRNIVCSDRWTEEWPLIVNQLRAQVWERRKQLRQKRRLAKMPMTSAEIEVQEVETIGAPPETKPKKQSKHPNDTEPKKPAANHPWRRSPIGRARYEPSKNARN